jgi:hypothetical protein
MLILHRHTHIKKKIFKNKQKKKQVTNCDNSCKREYVLKNVIVVLHYLLLFFQKNL